LTLRGLSSRDAERFSGCFQVRSSRWGLSTYRLRLLVLLSCACYSKLNGWRLWNFALEGVTSFSTVPLRVWTYLGGLIALLSFLYGVYMILAKIIFGNPVPGYPSLMVTVLLLSGVQLIGIGVLGEYIGRTYLESKRRPLHIVRQVWRRAPDGASRQVIDYPRQRNMR
jgi:hypothetical protein